MSRFWQHVFTTKLVQCDGSPVYYQNQCCQVMLDAQNWKSRWNLEKPKQESCWKARVKTIKASRQMSSDYVYLTYVVF